MKMRYLIIAVCLTLALGCSISKTTMTYPDGIKESRWGFDLMSMRIEKKHASLRSDKGVGFALKFSAGSNSPLPELKLGYWGSNQTFTPMVEATFDENGNMIRKEALPSTLIKLGSDPVGGKAVDDVSATGIAAQEASKTYDIPLLKSLEAEITEDWANE